MAISSVDRNNEGRGTANDPSFEVSETMNTQSEVGLGASGTSRSQHSLSSRNWVNDFRKKKPSKNGDEPGNGNQRYVWYYVSGLFCNSAILSFYSVQAFKESPECLSSDGKHDISEWFDRAFEGSFGLLLANFLFFAFIGPHVRNVETQH